MPASLRIELFPTDLLRTIDFYTRILRFTLLRHEPACITTPATDTTTTTNPSPSLEPYAYLRRDSISIGAAEKLPQLQTLAATLLLPHPNDPSQIPNPHSDSNPTPNPEPDLLRLHPLRAPPLGVEIVLEVDDLPSEREYIVSQGWPLDADIQAQAWGLRDFRVRDPDGYYVRITEGGDGHGQGV
jgi:lactoylglutathione lyase